MTGINITWEVSSNFKESKIKDVLGKYGCTYEAPTTPYEKWVAKAVGVTVKLFAKKLLVQGRENAESLELIQELSELECLILDRRNAEKFAKLFPALHNAILCTECNRPSLLIEGKIEGLDITFHKECGHKNNLHPPLFMLTSRILPDVNVLVGGHLSKCINLGYFEGFEVVIPDYIMHVLDLLEPRKKKGASNEIERLRGLEKDNKITIFSSKDGLPIPTKEEFQSREDDDILEIANLTNSILFTGDENLKDKATLVKRPTIYIHPSLSGHIKIIEETRNP